MEKVGFIKKLAITINVLAWIYLIAMVIVTIFSFVEEFSPVLIISLVLSGLVGFVILLTFGKTIEILIDIRSSQLINNIDKVNIETIKRRELKEPNNRPEEEIEVTEISEENLHILNNLIQNQKKKLWGSSQKIEIITLIKSLVVSKSSAEKLVLEYKDQFDKYLIEDLKGISSSYDTIRDYLDIFIEHNIVSETYPHDRLN